jgi:hypothetical protein
MHYILKEMVICVVEVKDLPDRVIVSAKYGIDKKSIESLLV